MSLQEQFRNKIDDYEQTIHAIVGFLNFYRFDSTSRKMRNDVFVFQGRRLEPSSKKTTTSTGEQINYVTPDVGILMPSKRGVLGEIKKSFPIEQDHWLKTFKQLMSYDDDLKGWPSDNEQIDSHDIVLILHQTRAGAVRRYYESKAGNEINFSRPFIIIQFNRADERKSYYFFQKVLGELTEKKIDDQLADGVSVPMDVFVKTYSTVKIYDSQPPLPYLMEIIWTHVILPRAAETERFEKLRKNQKIDIVIDVDKIVEELHKGFSFHDLHGYIPDRQPKIPKKEWVATACDQLVKSKEASWTDATKKSVSVFFRKYDDTLGHFIECCSGQTAENKQIELFTTNSTDVKHTEGEL